MNTRSSADIYAGSWDWDRIYRACHRAGDVAERIAPHLGEGPVLFAGFPSVAADLAASRDVTFVDWSKDLARRARANYPAIQSVVAGDVLEILAESDPPNIVLSGRISAFWRDVAIFDRLAEAYQSHLRSSLVIDFFDAGALAKDQELRFGTPPTTGTWRVTGTDRAGGITRVTLSVTYDLDGDRRSLDTTRSYFDRGWVLEWAKRAFPVQVPRILDPLIPGDPGFAVAIR